MAEEKEVAAAWEIFSHDGRVRWFAKDKWRRYGGWIDSPEKLGRSIDVAAALGRDFYLQANICRPDFNGVKCTTADITHWRMLIVDIDPIKESLGIIIPGLIMRHYCVLNSGRGFQYWLRMPPEEVTDSGAVERGMAATLRKSFIVPDSYKVDTTCSDLARVVRCPGSLNTKTNRWATMICVNKPHRCHDRILALAGPAPEPVKAVEGVESGNLLEVLPHLNGTSRSFLLSGVSTPGRHSRAFSTTKNLSEIGATREQVERWVGRAAESCSPPLHQSDVRRIVRQVYGG